MIEILMACLDQNYWFMGKSTKKYVSKFMKDNLRNLKIKKRFLHEVQKIELINWEWFGIPHAAQRKLPLKMYCYDNILPGNYLSYFTFN